MESFKLLLCEKKDDITLDINHYRKNQFIYDFRSNILIEIYIAKNWPKKCDKMR